MNKDNKTQDINETFVNAQPLKILVVLPGYPVINGIPSYGKWLVDELKRQHKVCVLVPGKAQQVSCNRVDDVKVFRIAIPMPLSKVTPLKTFIAWIRGFLRQLRQIKQLVAEQQIQVVHTTFHSYNYIFRVLRLLGGPPYLVTLHGSETVFFEKIPRFDRLLSKNLISSADRVAAVSDTLKAVAQQRFPGAPVVTAYNGIDFSASPQPFEQRESGMSLPERFCILVGRLHPVKGIDTAIDAWQKVTQQEPDVHLLIVGGGDCCSDYEARIDRLALSDRVHLIGAQDNDRVRWLMEHAEVLVMPSRSEGFPAVCLEAAKAALPIVASKVGGIPEIVEDGENGFLVAPQAPQELAEKVVYLLQNSSERLKFGDNLLTKAKQHFSSDRGASVYLHLYRQLLD